MPGLAEFVVLGCHTDDGYDPEALAMVAHLLRQPPDYPQALARPLPLDLAASPRNTPCPPVSRRRRRRRTNQVPLGTQWTTRTPHCRRPPDSTRHRVLNDARRGADAAGHRRARTAPRHRTAAAP
ncbi:RNaseH domain-containing protein [Streptomyces sp. NBC_00154]|uniref:RNaseH domain-containing protein n=1 Tax=Streptomyces sp. NBC_00154 TaxID=2975670 RepID=UPI0022550223|nr:RNaseH domain-containing protein [Streptomyces sp. NBC_00154]MCX5316191.1 RNAseH domain-containing protein [Streptomyces sp. NBC_00154]